MVRVCDNHQRRSEIADKSKARGERACPPSRKDGAVLDQSRQIPARLRDLRKVKTSTKCLLAS